MNRVVILLVSVSVMFITTGVCRIVEIQIQSIRVNTFELPLTYGKGFILYHFKLFTLVVVYLDFWTNEPKIWNDVCCNWRGCRISWIKRLHLELRKWFLLCSFDQILKINFSTLDCRHCHLSIGAYTIKRLVVFYLTFLFRKIGIYPFTSCFILPLSLFPRNRDRDIHECFAENLL